LTDPFYKPIPLDLLILEGFTDLPTQRGTGLLRGFGGGNRIDAQPNTLGMSPESATDSRVVYPCTILHTGRFGGRYTVYAESAQARSEWKDKLQEAIGLRKVFEVETLSSDTLVVGHRAWMGKINCSVPFSKQIVLSRIVVGEF
jgi:RHO1 GDP-GTP exchange protein 1/2